MGKFYTMLKQNQNIRDYIKEFNSLNKEEIKDLFEDAEIDFELKRKIAEQCYERISKLPFDIFVLALSFIDDPQIFSNNYQNRINSLSYEEVITLLYEAYIDRDCLIEITKMTVFKRYLSYEKERKIGAKIQNFHFLKELYQNHGNIEQVDMIGEEIKKVISTEKLTEEIDSLIECYLKVAIEKDKDLPVQSNIYQTGIFMINTYLKQHKPLSDTMIEFYILFHLKELDLNSICKHVIIDSQDSSVFGYYRASTRTLKINSNWVRKRFDPLFKEANIQDENEIHDQCNLYTLSSISHELGHIDHNKEVEKFQEGINSIEDYEQMQKSPLLYYWYKNGLLHILLGEEKYLLFHDQFIEEIRADLFSVFDFGHQLNKYFKNSFKEIQIQMFCQINAEKIIRFYTEIKDNKRYITSPMKKFDQFCGSYLPEKDNRILTQKLEKDSSLSDIMKNLLLGDFIPEYLLKEIFKIARKEILTTDIYDNIANAFYRQKDISLEEAKKK